MLGEILTHWAAILLWGGLATVVMTTVLEAAQMTGLTRLALPFLFGTLFTADRQRATSLGYVLHVLGGWVFALVYALVLDAFPHWWVGALTGVVHGLFLVTVVQGLLSEWHPRVAGRHEGPSARGKLENPGPLGLHFGWPTPITTVLAQTLFGLVFALGYLATI